MTKIDYAIIGLCAVGVGFLIAGYQGDGNLVRILCALFQ